MAQKYLGLVAAFFHLKDPLDVQETLLRTSKRSTLELEMSKS